VKKFALLGAAIFLAACSKDIQNKEALRQGMMEYLQARTSQTGLDVNLMDIDISGMSFERDQARATVVFRPKGATEANVTTLTYAFDRKGDKWVVRGRQDTGSNPHGAGGTLPPPNPDPGVALPPGHPPTSGASPKQ
jgi:hypothetical protein